MAMRDSPGRGGPMPIRRKPLHRNQQLGRAMALAQDTARTPPPGGSLGGPPGADLMFAQKPGGAMPPQGIKPGMGIGPPQLGPQYADGGPQGGGGFKPPMGGGGFGPMMSDHAPQIPPEMMAAFAQMNGGAGPDMSRKPMVLPPPPGGPMPGRPAMPPQFPGPPMEQIPAWQRMR